MIWNELVHRGLVKQCTNHAMVRTLLNDEDEKITFYLGIDPTADSLHVGHLLPIVTAKRLVDAGHQAIIVIGNATAAIGDPSGKSSARKMLSSQEIWNNSGKILSQVGRLLPSPSVRFLTNSSWLNMSMPQFLQEVGPHLSVNTMLKAECFKSRMENGLSFLEFNYMAFQAFDFFALHRDKNCQLQIGGDDQWSNMLAGIDLIHKKTGEEVFALTLPLLVNSDGTKMGKTEKGAVWLDAEKTSPFEFFQFWRNIPDDQVEKCMLFFTQSMDAGISKSINLVKKDLAFEVTKLVHGESIARQALEQAEALFEKRNTSELEATPISEGIHILEAIVKCGFAKSRTEARNLIINRGITINEEVQTNPTIVISKNMFGSELVIRKGKKHFCRLLIEDKCPDQIT